MLYHSPLFAFLHILKLSEFSYTDQFAVLVICFWKDQKRRNSAPSFSTTVWLYIATLLYLEAAAIQNSGQKKDSGNFAIAFNTRISHLGLDKKVTTALSSSVKKSSVFSTQCVPQHHAIPPRAVNEEIFSVHQKQNWRTNNFMLLLSSLFKHSTDIIHYIVFP